jgi:hypothetical protein
MFVETIVNDNWCIGIPRPPEGCPHDGYCTYWLGLGDCWQGHIIDELEGWKKQALSEYLPGWDTMFCYACKNRIRSAAKYEV